MFFIGGIAATLIRLHLIEPTGALVQPATYNKLFTMHGMVMIFFFLIPSIPAVLGNFLVPMMVGARDLAFPRINLLSWYLYIIGGAAHAVCDVDGRRGYGLDVLYALQQHVRAYAGDRHGAGRVYHRIFFDSDRLEFHRDDSQDARAGADLVPYAAFYLGHVCDQHHSDSGDAGAGDYVVLLAAGAAVARGDFRSRDWRRSDFVSASVLVLFASGGLHHDFAGDGSDERIDCVLFAQADFRLFLRGVFEHGDRGAGLSGVGPPHVCYRAIGLCRTGFFGAEFHGGDSFGD